MLLSYGNWTKKKTNWHLFFFPRVRGVLRTEFHGVYRHSNLDEILCLDIWISVVSWPQADWMDVDHNWL